MSYLPSKKMAQKAHSVLNRTTKNGILSQQTQLMLQKDNIVSLYHNHKNSKNPDSKEPDAVQAPRVLFAVTELYPFVKLGGLGDVAASFPPAMQKQGVDIRYFLPGYPQIKKNLRDKKTVYKFPELFGQKSASLLLGILPNGLMAYVLDAPAFFERPHPYLDENKKDWSDNHLRFGAFCYAAANLAHYDPEWQPDVFHGNDWQCGLIPAYKNFHGLSPAASSVITIHNMCYQGLFPAETREQLALPAEGFTLDGYEFYNQVGFLKAGLYYADRITTVSPTHAWEICTHPYGFGLEGLLAKRRDQLKGVLNGVNTEIWDTQKDPLIRYHYGPKATAARKKNKAVILKDLGLNGREDEPFFAFVGRLTPQKGLDILLKSIEALANENVTFMIMGAGDRALEEKCHNLAKKYPDRISFFVGCDEKLEHRLYAGADAVIMPSYFEPCGMVQLYALRYGALPIVRRTGGLSDSVTEEMGFLFDQAKAKDLQQAILEALHIYRHMPDVWKSMQKTAMAQDFTWNRTAKNYLSIYMAMIGNKQRKTRRRSLLS